MWSIFQESTKTDGTIDTYILYNWHQHCVQLGVFISLELYYLNIVESFRTKWTQILKVPWWVKASDFPLVLCWNYANLHIHYLLLLYQLISTDNIFHFPSYSHVWLVLHFNHILVVLYVVKLALISFSQYSKVGIIMVATYLSSMKRSSNSVQCHTGNHLGIELRSF